MKLVINNPEPRLPLYEDWPEENFWHEEEEASANGLLALFGFACFGAGSLFTAAMAWIIWRVM